MKTKNSKRLMKLDVAALNKYGQLHRTPKGACKNTFLVVRGDGSGKTMVRFKANAEQARRIARGRGEVVVTAGMVRAFHQCATKARASRGLSCPACEGE